MVPFATKAGTPTQRHQVHPNSPLNSNHGGSWSLVAQRNEPKVHSVANGFTGQVILERLSDSKPALNLAALVCRDWWMLLAPSCGEFQSALLARHVLLEREQWAAIGRVVPWWTNVTFRCSAVGNQEQSSTFLLLNCEYHRHIGKYVIIDYEIACRRGLQNLRRHINACLVEHDWQTPKRPVQLHKLIGELSKRYDCCTTHYLSEADRYIPQ